MKKLAIDVRFWGPSHTGLGRYTESLVKALYALKPKLAVTLLANDASYRRLRDLFPRWQVIKTSCRHYSMREQLVLPKILNQIKPDLVHFLHFNMPLNYRGKFIVTIHDLIKHHSRGLETTTQWPLFYPIKRLGYQLVISHAIKNSQRILTPSRWVKKDIQKFYQVESKKIIITSEAAGEIFFNQKKFNYGLVPAKPYLIYTGNAYPHKNIVQLIKAIGEYNRQYQAALNLVVVTAKDFFYQRLRLQMRKLTASDFVKIKGFTDDASLAGLYFKSIAFITASKFEGFGLPGLEAMAAGTLVLSSNRASLPEVYNQQALYFNPEDINSIVRVIRQAVNLKNRSQQINRNQRYARSFSWQKTAKQTLKSYEDCLSV